jgi:hypothetical protein
MLQFTTRVKLAGVSGRDITEFLLDCTDEEYQRWWPGEHLAFHAIDRRPGDIGNVMILDEWVGQRRLRLKAMVRDVVEGERIVWQMIWLVRLPVWLTVELNDVDDGVIVTHTLDAGRRGFASVVNPVLRCYFTPQFAQDLDDHVRSEFPRLRDLLVGQRAAAA